MVIGERTVHYDSSNPEGGGVAVLPQSDLFLFALGWSKSTKGVICSSTLVSIKTQSMHLQN